MRRRAVLRSMVYQRVGAIMLLITAAAARENGARKIAELPRASQLPATAVAKPIPAWIEFCRRFPAECRIDLREPATIKLTAEVWNTIRTVNSRVNASIIPITDHEQWGVPDRWDLPITGYGDCEVMQLLKRKLLAERGLLAGPCA